jgi:acetyl esterase
VHQLLVYPVTDLASFDRPAYKAHADAKPLNRAMMEWFKKEYVKDEVEAAKEYASPLRAKELKDLPPATVITADLDPLRDDGRQYALALTKAGVDVAYKKYDGVTHEFFGMGAVVDEGKQAVAFAAKRLKGSWGK